MVMTNAANPILRVENLRHSFPVRGGFFNRVVKHVHAVNGLSFQIPRGKTLGLIGESGCGKTTVARLLLRFIEPISGKIWFRGESVLSYSPKQMRSLRAQIQMVYQDPYSSMNPRMKIGHIIAEPLWIHKKNRNLDDSEIEERVIDVIHRVGLHKSDLNKFPHMFSGGQRQRIGIARALILEPDLLVLDEPTSALDVSIQAKLLKLLLRLQREMNLTYIFISHDMRVIRLMADEVAVMYLGKIVEYGPIEKVFSNPLHPYTQGLLAAMPSPDPNKRLEQLAQLKGEVGDPSNVPTGCPFWPRCPEKIGPICEKVAPQLLPVSQESTVSCHIYHDLNSLPESKREISPSPVQNSTSLK
jgi:oligopeptide/dipeptide ABC transporter ATP-binding protein